MYECMNFDLRVSARSAGDLVWEFPANFGDFRRLIGTFKGVYGALICVFLRDSGYIRL